jgi:acyl carrier protein
MDATETRTQIKRLIVERLNLEGLSPGEIEDDAPLLQSLGLDSVDALELVLGLEQTFDVKIAGKGVDKSAFASVATLADFVQECVAARDLEGSEGTAEARGAKAS